MKSCFCSSAARKPPISAIPKSTEEMAKASSASALVSTSTPSMRRIDVLENSSVLADEGVAHRVGLIPLKTDLSKYNESDKILLVLDSGESEETRAVLSGELSSEDESVKPVSEKIPIVQLAPGQKIKIECYARLGRGTEHAKWNSSNISMLTDTDKDDEKILTVESTGALNPEQIVLEGVQEVSRRVVEFKDMINNIEE